MKKFLSVISAVMALCFLFAGCGSSAKLSSDNTAMDFNGYDDYSYEMDLGENPGMENGASNGATDSKIPAGRKIILTASIRYETKQYNDSLELVLKKISDNGGYIQSSNYYGNDSDYSSRSCSITARIPSENYSAFLSQLDDAGSLVNKTESSEDITAQYVDVEARLTSLKTEEETLLSILEEAQTLEEVILLQDKLTDVRYQIEYYTSTQRTYDDLVDYSTVNIELDEVKEYTPVKIGFGDRVKTAFIDSLTGFVNGLQDFVIALIFMLPGLVVLAVIALIIVVIVKLSMRHSRKKRAAMPVPPQVIAPVQLQQSRPVSPTAIPTAPLTPPQKENGDNK